MALQDKADRITAIAENVSYWVASANYRSALREISALPDVISDLAADLAQAVYDDGGTKKEIAGLLGVPASTFRGMTRGEA